MSRIFKDTCVYGEKKEIYSQLGLHIRITVNFYYLAKSGSSQKI